MVTLMNMDLFSPSWLEDQHVIRHQEHPVTPLSREGGGVHPPHIAQYSSMSAATTLSGAQSTVNTTEIWWMSIVHAYYYCYYRLLWTTNIWTPRTCQQCLMFAFRWLCTWDSGFHCTQHSTLFQVLYSTALYYTLSNYCRPGHFSTNVHFDIPVNAVLF